MDHRCERCGTAESYFWFPHSEGCGRKDSGYAAGGRYYELCDSCQLEYIRWMSNPREWSVKHTGGSQ